MDLFIGLKFHLNNAVKNKHNIKFSESTTYEEVKAKAKMDKKMMNGCD